MRFPATRFGRLAFVVSGVLLLLAGVGSFSQRSDRDQLYRSRNDTSISDFPSPDSNPPSYGDGAFQAADNFRSRSWSSNTKSLPEDGLENREERTALLLDLSQSQQR